MPFDLSRYWYRPNMHMITGALLPLSWMFGSAAAVRRWMFRNNIIKTQHVHVPVIVVGNITVGGTGKTPFVIWLAEFLRAQGYRPGIVSRGVGSQKKVCVHVVSLSDSAQQVGDEAILLRQKTNCPVVIGVDRPAAVRKLLELGTCDIIISDDGLQHYRMGRDIEIALIDGLRRFGNEKLLPAGPLREPIKRLQRVDMVVVNGGEVNDSYSVSFTPTKLFRVNDETSQQSLSQFSGQVVHAIAGIGHPERFFLMLKQAGLQVIPHVFPDHHSYKTKDLQFDDAYPVLMTEKDAVKCRAFADERCWFLGLATKVEESLQQKLLTLLRECRL